LEKRFQRLGFLIGEDGLKMLSETHVAIFGIGGVGSFTTEALVRAGVGKVTLIDYDTIDITNLNRQIHALEGTVGLLKVEVMAERLKEINPDVDVVIMAEKIMPDTTADFFKTSYDYVVDAIDMVSSKLALIETCIHRDIPIMSSMGTGNKLDPTRLEVTDIYKTSVCPLARVMRHELKKRGVKRLKVVYSSEQPLVQTYDQQTWEVIKDARKKPPGSTSFVPSVAGLIIASQVIKDILKR
jgi:tRNA A37 threonylcarbamoyladenosine dehydratase